MNRPPSLLAHGVIYPMPQATVLLTLDDCQDFPLSRLLLGLPSVGKALAQALRPIVFPIFPIGVAVFGRGPQP